MICDPTQTTEKNKKHDKINNYDKVKSAMRKHPKNFMLHVKNLFNCFTFEYEYRVHELQKALNFVC